MEDIGGGGGRSWGRMSSERCGPLPSLVFSLPRNRGKKGKKGEKKADRERHIPQYCTQSLPESVQGVYLLSVLCSISPPFSGKKKKERKGKEEKKT